ncbi:MAG: hypothetical protein FJ088_12305, partial [Deltaproteobacteria bacterium]|nr:hypothetical protein [Deltaproteobacteria bacterium]
LDGKNWSAFSGCTDPKALEKDGDKAMLVIYNTTDKCAGDSEVFHLNIRLNGKPLAGVAPGKKTIAYIEKGDYYLEVLKGDTSERLIKGERGFYKNSLLHHGCSKPGGK